MSIYIAHRRRKISNALPMASKSMTTTN